MNNGEQMRQCADMPITFSKRHIVFHLNIDDYILRIENFRSPSSFNIPCSIFPTFSKAHAAIVCGSPGKNASPICSRGFR